MCRGEPPPSRAFASSVRRLIGPEDVDPGTPPCALSVMARSATDILDGIINAAVVDAIVALKHASKGLPNALLRDLNAIHANTAYSDLPKAIQAAVATSVRDAFVKLKKEGYVVADAKSVRVTPERQAQRAGPNVATDAPRRTPTRSGPGGRHRPAR